MSNYGQIQLCHVRHLMPYKLCHIDYLIQFYVLLFVSKGVKTWTDPFKPEDKR